MIYSKLCSNAFKKTSKDNLLHQRYLFNQNYVFYSILNRSKQDNHQLNENKNSKQNDFKQLLQKNVFYSNDRCRFYLNNSFNNPINRSSSKSSTKLPILYKNNPKSLSTQIKSSNDDEILKFKKISTEGNLNLVQTQTPIELVVPKSLIPYIELLRLNRFAGTAFLLYPCLWSISLGGVHGDVPNFKLMGMFAIGAMLMRSAGCIINDLMDKEFDKKVERTKSRPLASGKLNNLEAFAALTACLTGALHILLSFDCLTIMYGASSLLLVTLYPLMKRVTNWPQLFLGFTFNWGAILGWSAIQNGLIDWKIVLPLYASGIFWTLIYDTIYAYQDYAHDKKLSLKSTTMIFGENPKIWLNTFAFGMASSLVLTGTLSNQLYPFYVGSALSTIHMLYIIHKLDIHDPNSCAKYFKFCQLIGYYILMGTMLSVFFDQKNKPPKKKINLDDVDLRDDKINLSDNNALL